MTQKQFASRLGIPEKTYAHYEAESSGCQPSLETLIKIAKELNVSTDYLLGLED